jgi:hypothetical protein
VIRPGSLRWRVLALLVDDVLTAAELAEHVRPPPRLAGPLTSRTAWAARAQAVEAHRATVTRSVSRALDALTAAGLVAPSGPPRVPDWLEQCIAQRGLASALERAHPAWPGPVPPLAAHRDTVAQCRQGPHSTREVIGEHPSGRAKRVWAEVCAWGWVVPPRGRTATEAGAALIRGTA